MINIKGTPNTPSVFLNDDGSKLVIKGRSYNENPKDFFSNIITNVKNNISSNIKVKLYLEYINTSSTKFLLELLKEIKFNSENVIINWEIDEDDDDMLELGEYYRDILKVPFNIKEIFE